MKIWKESVVNKMKQIIVLESRGQIGGACESIKLLLREIGHKVDLMIPKDEEAYLSKRDVKKFYGGYIENVYEFYLPYSVQNTVACEVYSSEDMKRKYRMFLQNKKEIYDFFERERYDNIHLNGIGLYPMLTKRFPMTLHMRQVFNGGMYQKLKRMHYLKKSQAIIYIDESTKKPFLSLKNRNIVLANPVDQTGVNEIDAQSYRKKYGIRQDDIVFCIQGTICEGKGTKFVIDTFNEMALNTNSHYILLVVGDGKGDYVKCCRELAKNNKNIIFTGRLPSKDMFSIYSISDWIIIADDVEGIGRGGWEALYSGCGLLIQGTERVYGEIGADAVGAQALNNNTVRVYKIRDQQSLIKEIMKIFNNKIIRKIGKSNIKQYAMCFNKFLFEMENH